MLEQLILGLHLLSYHPDMMQWKEERCYSSGIPHDVSTVTWKPTQTCVVTPVERKPNGNNPGLYVRDARTGFGGGFYRNSEERWSAHADWTYEPHPNVGLTFGVATGYERATLLPVFVPSVKVRIPQTKVDARLSYIHGGREGSDAFHLSIETLTWR